MAKEVEGIGGFDLAALFILIDWILHPCLPFYKQAVVSKQP